MALREVLRWIGVGAAVEGGGTSAGVEGGGDGLVLRARGLRKEYGSKVVYGGEDLEIGSGRSVGLVGKNGAGKSTLLRMICGVEGVSGGSVGYGRGVRVSWPVGYGGGMDGRLSGRSQYFFMGRLMGLGEGEIEEKLRWVGEMSGLEREIRGDVLLGAYSSGMRGRFSFFASMSFDFDVYCFDEVLAVGDAVFKTRSRELVGGLKERGKVVVMATHNLEELRELADDYVLVRAGAGVGGGSRLERYETVDRLVYEYARIGK